MKKQIETDPFGFAFGFEIIRHNWCPVNIRQKMTAQIITSIGLILDIIGALLVANEVVRVFKGPTTIDVGGAGLLDGGFIPKPNPAYEAHESKKRKIMAAGLLCLFCGFILQGVGAWWPVFICKA